MWTYDDFMDPAGALQRLAFGQAQQPLLGQPKPELPPLTPEREESMLARISGAGLGGLGYVGSVLEKTLGGRAVRGLLGGKPRELLSVLPGSDLAGITKEEDRVSGRDLLRNWGAIGQDDNWGNFAGGLALEMALDPSMYLTFGAGALSKAGQVAQKIGRAPKGASARVGGNLRSVLAAEPGLQQAAETAAGGSAQLAGMLDAPLGGLFGVKVPFTGWQANIGEGASGLAALDAAGRAGRAVAGAHRYLDKLPYGGSYLYNTLTLGAPKAMEYLPGAARWLGRHARALLDSRVKGSTSELGQEIMLSGDKALKEAQGAANFRLLTQTDELKRLGLEGDDLARAVEGYTTPVNARARELVGELQGDLAARRQGLVERGVDVGDFRDPYTVSGGGYLPRQLTPAQRVPGAGESTAALKATDPRLMTGREEILLGFNEGRAGVNRMSRDALAYNGTPMERAAHIRENYLSDPAAVAQAMLARGEIDASQLAATTAELAKRQNKQARALVDWLDGLGPEYRQGAGTDKALSAFGHDPIADLMGYHQRAIDLQFKADAAHQLLAKTAFERGAGALPEGAAPLTSALQKAGLMSGRVSEANAASEAMALAGYNKAQQALGPARPVTSLADLYVGPESMAEIGRYMRPFSSPEAAHPFLRAYDWFTNLFKTYVTAPFPGFQVRNLTSGQLANVGEAGAGVLGHVPGAKRILAGEAYEGLENLPIFAGRNLTAREATDEVARLYAAYGASGHPGGHARDIVGAAGGRVELPRAMDDVLATIPGRQPATVRGAASKYLGLEGDASLNPLQALNIQGVNSSVDKFAPVAGGRAMGEVVEGVNRLPLFIKSLEEGYTPAEAAARVLRTQYNYAPSSLTPFEQSWMKRLVPFYSFQRGNIPAVLNQLATNPGGLAGVSAKAALNARQQPGTFLPAYMGEGLAVPIGEMTPEGRQRYLTKVDTPAEAAFEMIKGTPRQTLMGLLGQLNPLIKGPLEYASDRQFFSGRELGDLYSMTGNQLLDHLIANSPLARAGSTVRTVTDPDKWTNLYGVPLNLLTGARVTDVDIPKYRNIAQREHIKSVLRGLPAVGKFESLYVRPELWGTLTPDELEAAQLQRLLQQRERQASQRPVRVGG
jgi:hypothetical protein